MAGTRKRRVNSIVAAPETGGVTLVEQAEDMDAAINAFLRYCNVKNLTKETLKYYKDCLDELRRVLNGQGITRPIDITRDSLYACIEEKKAKVSENSVNMYMRAWRAFFNYLADENYLPDNPYAGIKMLKTEKTVIETFSKEQIRQLLAACDRTKFTGYRNYVLISLLLDTGVRIAEAEGIRVTGIHWRDRVIKVLGKGRKERLVPFSSRLERHLREYVKIRGVLDHDFLFVNIDNEPWRRRSMQETVAKLGAEAGIRGVRCSPHTMRHTFARMYIVNGGDIFSLQKILGHSSLDMVRNYVNLWGTDIAEKHARYSPLDRLDRED